LQENWCRTENSNDIVGIETLESRLIIVQCGRTSCEARVLLTKEIVAPKLQDSSSKLVETFMSWLKRLSLVRMKEDEEQCTKHSLSLPSYSIVHTFKEDSKIQKSNVAELSLGFRSLRHYIISGTHKISNMNFPKVAVDRSMQATDSEEDRPTTHTNDK